MVKMRWKYVLLVLLALLPALPIAIWVTLLLIDGPTWHLVVLYAAFFVTWIGKTIHIKRR